jgi:hypothetical protein
MKGDRNEAAPQIRQLAMLIGLNLSAQAKCQPPFAMDGLFINAGGMANIFAANETSRRPDRPEPCGVPRLLQGFTAKGQGPDKFSLSDCWDIGMLFPPALALTDEGFTSHRILVSNSRRSQEEKLQRSHHSHSMRNSRTGDVTKDSEGHIRWRNTIRRIRA